MPDLSTAVDRQGLRLARLLRAYEEHLPAAELTLLGRLCLLRRSVPWEQVRQLFLCQPAVHACTARALAEPSRYRALLIAEAPEADADDVAEAVHGAIEEMLWAAPIAGPETLFKEQIAAGVAHAFDPRNLGPQITIGAEPELIRLYAGREHDGPTDSHPLSANDRASLLILWERYGELRAHPSMPYHDVPSILEAAFAKEGYAKKKARGSGDPAGHLHLLMRLRTRIQHLLAKHFVLRHVRQLCRIGQRKWTLAGSLASLDESELRQVLMALVGRHLLLQEGDGSFGVHPAVRDHFYRQAQLADGGDWHDFIREQLLSVTGRPGAGRPEDAATLDLVEEAIFHALEAGRTNEAWRLFDEVLGGVRHLAWKLGEINRGLRILRAFPSCPDRWALAWMLRALGELDDAYVQNELPYFRADLRLLQGRLPEVEIEGDPARSAIARFLMGQTTTLPPQPLSCPISRDQMLLYRGLPGQVSQTALFVDLYDEMGWQGDRARCLLILADATRRLGDLARTRQHVQAATPWILHSGSVEHLCLFHLVSARMELDSRDLSAAQRSLREGLPLARRSSLGLYLVELLCTQAELDLVRGDAESATHHACEALARASAETCQFMWGAAEAGHLLGLALARRAQVSDAHAILSSTLDLRRRIGDPRAEVTATVLRELPR